MHMCIIEITLGVYSKNCVYLLIELSRFIHRCGMFLHTMNVRLCIGFRLCVCACDLRLSCVHAVVTAIASSSLREFHSQSRFSFLLFLEWFVAPSIECMTKYVRMCQCESWLLCLPYFHLSLFVTIAVSLALNGKHHDSTLMILNTKQRERIHVYFDVMLW